MERREQEIIERKGDTQNRYKIRQNHKDQTKEMGKGKEMWDTKVKTSERQQKIGDRKPEGNACDVSG